MLAPLSLMFVALAAHASSGEIVRGPERAQARLAEALADAESVDWVRAHGQTVTFAIDKAMERFEIDVTSEKHRIVGVDIRFVGPQPAQHGELSWLGREMTEINAVRALDVDDDGNVTLTTDDGRNYRVIPDRHDGNTAVEARWAAEWNNT
jgi:hypothetical protein